MITLTLDCGKSGSDFGCEQVFEGSLKGDGLEGSWSGTGGGGVFKADSGGYKSSERKIILSDNTAQIKTFAVNFDGQLLKSADNMLNIGAGSDSNAMVFFVKPNHGAFHLDPIKNHISETCPYASA